jgi:hypothetical protein
MSLSPSLPPGAPSLADVLIERTFAKPPQPFVDGEFIEALSHADDDHPSVAATAAAASAHGHAGAGTPGAALQNGPAPAHAPAPAAGARPGTTIDVRA